MAENSGGSLGNETVRIGLIWENEVATLNKVVAEAQALVKDGMKDGVQIKIDESAFAKDVQKMLGTMSKQLSKVKLTGMDAGSLKSFSTMTAGLANLSRRFDTNGISKATTTFEKLAQAASLAAVDAQKAVSTITSATNQIGTDTKPITVDVDLSDLKADLKEVTTILRDTSQVVQDLVTGMKEQLNQLGDGFKQSITNTVNEARALSPSEQDAAIRRANADAIRAEAEARKALSAAQAQEITTSKKANPTETESQIKARTAAIQNYEQVSQSLSNALNNVDTTNKIPTFIAELDRMRQGWEQARISAENYGTMTTRQLNDAAKAAQRTQTALEKMELNTKYNTSNSKGAWFDLSQSGDFVSQARQAVSVYGQLVQGTEQYSVSAGKWQATVQAQNGDLIQLKATMDSTGTGYRMLETHLSESASAFKRVGITFKEIATNYIRYFSGQQLVTRVIGQVRKGWNEIKELDAAYTELRKVSDETTAALQSFRAESYGIANDAVSTGKAIQQSAADWVRLGKSIEDAAEFAKNTSIYANVGDMDIDTATEHMISTVQAFRDDFETEVIASAEIADIFNELDNNFAITAEGLGSAMERAAAALVAANNDIYQSAALVTAGNTIMQDPELMGNTLKVVSMRIRGAKAELEEMGEETEGVAESTSKLRREILALTGVDIMTDANTFKSTYDILDEISKIFDDLSDVSQANVLETLAGKLRGSAVAALLDNFDIAREALDAAINSEGSAARENAAYAESIEGHLMKIQNTWQQIWSDTTTRESVNLFLDMANGASELLQQVGLLNAAFGILMGYLSSKSGVGRGEMFPLIEYADCTLVVTRNEYNPRGYIRVC